MKKILCYALFILILVGDIFAIGVDNDGSAFITKAEFDSLKNNFQSQIDAYNTNIDSKIDTAIAAYLSGVSIANTPIDKWSAVKSNCGGELWFLNNVADTGQSTITTELFVSAERHYTYRAVNNLVSAFGMAIGGNGAQVYVKHNVSPGSIIISGNDAWFVSQNSWTATKMNHDTRECSAFYTSKNLSSLVTTVYRNVTNGLTTTSAGSGKVWIWHNNPGNKMILRDFASSYWPLQTVICQGHTYRDFGSNSASSILSYYFNDNGLGDSSSLSMTLTDHSGYGSVTAGTKSGDNNTTSSSTYYLSTLAQIKATDTIDYSKFQWGKNLDTQIYTVEDVTAPTLETSYSTATVPSSTFYSIYYTPAIDKQQTNTLSGITIKYKKSKIAPVRRYLYSFTNEYISSVANETVYLGSGAPLFMSTDSEQNLRLKLKFKLTDASGTAKTGNVYYQISDKPFSKGDFTTGATKIKDTTSVAAGTTVTLDITAPSQGITYWINMYAATSGYRATLDTFDVSNLF